MLDRFGTLRVAVLGDAVLDVWLHGDASRLCRDGPVPNVRVSGAATAPGAAANTAANVAAMGARVQLVTSVGDDPDAETLRRELAARDVAVDAIACRSATMVKRRLVVDGQVVARFDQGDDGPVPDEVQRELVARVRRSAADIDLLIIADYGLGTLGQVAVERLVAEAGHLPALVVDAHEPARWSALHPALATPSWREAVTMLGETVGPEEDRSAYVERNGRRLLRATGAGRVAVTLDHDGAVLVGPGGAVHRAAARPAPESRTAGAGDTFVAALALALAAGADEGAGLEVAVAAATLAVDRPGTTTCSAGDLRAAFALDPGGVLTLDTLVAELHGLRGRRRVILTNGCFDILHRGHVEYLRQAKQLGDVLVVGVNSDDSIRRLKGTDRPVSGEQDRAAVVAALGCVDHVVVFDSDTAVPLVEALLPDVYVKGGDYTAAMLPETGSVHRYGGEVRILGYHEGHSTTRVLDLIRRTGPA